MDSPVREPPLRDTLWIRLSESLDGLTRNGHPTECLPGNLNVSFDGVDGEALLNAMTEIAVSSGSACTSADPEPSHVLLAMGVDERTSRSSLRFSLGRTSTASDVRAVVQALPAAVERARRAGSVSSQRAPQPTDRINVRGSR